MSIEYIRYTIDADRHAPFLKDYKAASEFLKSSPYCLSYELSQGEEEPDNFILRIVWTSTKDHLEGFRTSGDFPKFFALVKPYFNDIQEMKHYTLSDITWSKK